MGKYDDIIHLGRPDSTRPRMPVADRAKIFQAFSALKGHEEQIEESQRLTVERIRLTEEKKEELDRALQLLQRNAAEEKWPEATIRHFISDEKASSEQDRELGNYVDTRGEVRRVDVSKGIITVGELDIEAKDIVEIQVQ